MSGPAASSPAARALPSGGAGTTLIEASAGTGKTRELTGVVAGLVVREVRRLDEILVVTFTRASTAELRDRIREALRAARQAVATGEAEEGSQAQELLAGWRKDAGFDAQTAARRLEAAIRDIDRANVLTIHGFCQRVLSDLAFDSGFPFGFEVSDDDTDLVARAARDFWRRRMYAASRTLAGQAVANGFRPEELAAWVRQWRGKPDLRIEGGEPPGVSVETQEAAWQGVLEETRGAWKEHRETFVDEVLNGCWLNRNRYRRERLESELASIEALLASPEPRLPADGQFGRYGSRVLEGACRRGHRLPESPLFAAFDRLEEASAELRAVIGGWLRWARREILTDARESIRRQVREDRRLGYDDLLLELHHALRSEGGERLAESIRRKYPSALIDEFQDTDPVQAEVFMRIYGKTGGPPEVASEAGTGREVPHDPRAGVPAGASGGTPDNGGSTNRSPREEGEIPLSGTGSGRTLPDGLCVVGDPKQSIYRFRGADVFAYLRARSAARTSRSLTRNWRSVPELVEAVNAVFAASNPFAVPEIAYPPVVPGRGPGNPLRVEETAGGAPLRFRLLPAGQDGRHRTKDEAAPLAAGDAAEEIAALLALAEEGGATVDERSSPGGGARRLDGADIAVLVRTRAQGRLVADALRERNVASVEVGDESVFDSREAEQMERLLRSLVEPDREARARGALAGDLFGLTAHELRNLGDDEEAWAGWSGRLRRWRSDWTAGGVGPLLRRLVDAEGGAARLLRFRDGARRLTNVRHLTELLQEAEAEQRMAPAALAAWFSRRRGEGRTRDEHAELRIESDEPLVRILTVHVAKGLEFPIVFLPFVWDARDPSRVRTDHAAYHGSEADGYPEVLDLDPDDAARATARREELSEELRLLYVALTRAKYRCVITWGLVRSAEHAPLAWLLHRGEGGTTAEAEDHVDSAVKAVAARFRDLGASKLHEEIRKFAAPHADRIAVTELADPGGPARPTVLAAPPAAPLAARRLDRTPRRTRQLTSFSALAPTATGPTGSPGTPSDVDRPDHDQHQPAAPAVEAELPAGEERGRNAFTFPRGPAAGSCLHRIFERLDRTPAEESDLDGICRETLAEFGFPDEWREVARTMVERARAARLLEPGGEETRRRFPSTTGTEDPNGFRLADPIPRLVEFEFAFPVAGLDHARLAARLTEHGYPDPFPPSPDVRPGEPLSPPIDGFLRGFVDLVVEHGGRWYIIDYKSNWLGPSPEHYAPAAVAAAMRSSAYPLQYLLYLVALHRYLGLRRPDYDYERHVGGVFYLFVRGMDPAAGMNRGVWFDRPAASFVRGLDRFFRGGTA